MERNYLQAQSLLNQKDYEAAQQLLEAVLKKVDEPALRKQLKEAGEGRLMIEQSTSRLLAAAYRLQSIGHTMRPSPRTCSK